MEAELPTSSMAEHVDAQATELDPLNLSNGDHNELASTTAPDHNVANDEAFTQNNTLPQTDLSVNIKDVAPTTSDPSLSVFAPTDTGVSGIQGVADFVPKDALNLSHPTPPPERLMGASDADVDTEMADVEDTLLPADSEPAPAPIQTSDPVASTDVTSTPVPATAPASVQAEQPEQAPAPVQASVSAQGSESSLVRPREEDEMDDAPAAKRTRLDVEHGAEELQDGERDGVLSEPMDALPASEPATTAALAGASDPSADIFKTEPPRSETLQADVFKEEAARSETLPADAWKVEDTRSVTLQADASAPKPAPDGGRAAQAGGQPSTEPKQASDAQSKSTAPQYSNASMTTAQHHALREKMKNLKKSKSAVNFLRPVDPVLLNIPSYPEIIKHPMDLSTMDTKLRTNEYHSVQDFADDFELIVSNCRTFNGETHAVTHAAMSMQAYFRKAMETIPSPSASSAPPTKVAKHSSPAVKPPPRREPRAATMPVAQADAPTFALQADGMPQIRRESSMANRPARAIKPPANREIPYAKPKRKEHQLELRFCEWLIDEIRGPKYANCNTVFLLPVDPVALNIPHYRQVIKQPMDLSTMGQKLKQGQYSNAKEFKKDFDLMIDNCLVFNPQGNPVRDLGVAMRRQFEMLWNGKEKWERARKPESQRGTSASDDDSAAEDDDEDDEPDDDKEQTIQTLQKQLADMQNLISNIAGGTKPAKSKKSKDKRPKQKLSSSSAPPLKLNKLPTPKPKKPIKVRQVTYDEKQEISEAVNRMNETQVTELTTIITQNCSRYRDMDEMELEIDDLPNDVQALLLKFVRKIFGKPKSATTADSPPDDGAFEDDAEFAPTRGSGGGSGGGGGGNSGTAGKRKKHKPMGKREQAEAISALKGKLSQFNVAGAARSESPTNSSSFARAKAESSGDEESEESEEE